MDTGNQSIPSLLGQSHMLSQAGVIVQLYSSLCIGGKYWISTMRTTILKAGWERKANVLLPQQGTRCSGLSVGTLSCSHVVNVHPGVFLFFEGPPCIATAELSYSFWKLWRAQGTPLFLTSAHERVQGISPDHLLSLVPQSTVGWVSEQICLNSLFLRSYFTKEGNKSMTGKVLTRQKLGSSMT